MTCENAVSGGACGRAASRGPAAVGSTFGKGIPLSCITDPSRPRYSEAGEIRSICENELDTKKIIDGVRGIEGLMRRWTCTRLA